MKKIKIMSIVMVGFFMFLLAGHSSYVEDNITAYAEETLYFGREIDGLVGTSQGILLAGCNDPYWYRKDGESSVKYTIDDESIAQIETFKGDFVKINLISKGETTLRAETPDGRTAEVTVKVHEYGENLRFSYEYVTEQAGESHGVFLFEYEENDSITYTIEDESIAKISYADVKYVNISFLSVGETTLKAETSDGRIAEIKLICVEPFTTTTFGSWTADPETTTTTAEKESDILGDANGDFKITISDSIRILQNIANADKYPLTAQQKINADVHNTGDGITGMDAQLIQQYDAGDLTVFPEAGGVLPDPEFEAVDTEARIEIKSYPDKLVYNIGEELDLTGGVYYVNITVKPDNFMEYTSQQSGDMSDLKIYDGNYTFGAPSYVDVSIDTSAFDNTKAGIYQIVIRADSESGRTTVPFEVEVK